MGVNGWGGTLLVLHSLLWIFRSCRELCGERCYVGMIEMKEGILFMEICDVYCIFFLLFFFLEVGIHSVV